MFLQPNSPGPKNRAPIYIFIFIAAILFRLLYGVPPVPSDFSVNVPAITAQEDSKSAPAVFSHQFLTISLKSEPSSENTNSKRLAPFKTFKNKIINDKSFNPTEFLVLRQDKLKSYNFKFVSLFQSKRFLTPQSNAPPVQK